MDESGHLGYENKKPGLVRAGFAKLLNRPKAYAS